MGRTALVLTMTDVFLCGVLADAHVRGVVLGHHAPALAASYAGHSLCGQDAFPLLAPQAKAVVAGVLLRGIDATALARLTFFAAATNGQCMTATVKTAEGPVVVQGFLPETAVPAEAWSFPDWAAQFGPTVLATARDIMALYGVKPAQAVQARLAQMLVRGAARVRAAADQPATVRLSADVQVGAQREPYARFFAVDEYDLAFRRFEGSASPTVTRAVFISGDAVTVLPYDPVRDRVLVVEQFRSGPFARGDSQPWQLEAIAGRIDTGETPEDAARREAVEESGLTLGALLPVANYYPSPGICAEYLYSYVAITDLPDDAAGVFGVEGEAEDIRGHLIGFDDLMALVGTGEIANAPLILTAFWLQARKGDLRGG